MKRTRLLPGVSRGPAEWIRLGPAALCLLVLQLLAFPSVAAAQASEGAVSASECCIEVLFPTAARAIALGQATVADTAPDAFFSNPAGLARLTAKRIVVHHTPLPDGEGQLNAVSLLLRPWDIGTLGLTYELLDLGSQEGRDENDNPTGELFAQDHMLAATFASDIGAGLSAGLTYELFLRYVPCDDDCEADVGGTTAMVDVGMQYRPRHLSWLAAGAAIAHAGLPLQIVNQEQADRTPLRVRAGASVQLLHFLRDVLPADSTLALWTSAQIEGSGMSARDPVFSVGAQLSVGDVLSVRTGYRGGSGTGAGVALGVGFTVDRFTLDVGKTVVGTLLSPDSPFSISLGILLDHTKEAARAGPPPPPSR